PTVASMRARSSSAAGAENVSARIPSGAAPSSTSQAKRATSVRVFPVPAPATTSSRPPGCVTASRWASVRPSRIAATLLGYEQMSPPSTALEADWLGLCRRATEGVNAILARSPNTRERAVETGQRGVARRGAGATVDGQRLDPAVGERRNRAGKLEVLGIESADPRWVAEVAADLPDHAARLRALGSIAITLCQVAAARLDGMFTIKRTRAVDAAAGQLIVREAGGHVAFPGADGPLGAPLDVQAHYAVVAARTARTLAELTALPRA